MYEIKQALAQIDLTTENEISQGLIGYDYSDLSQELV